LDSIHTRLHINGIEHDLDVRAGTSPLTVLRDHLQLLGSRYGCGHGVCDAPEDIDVLFIDDPGAGPTGLGEPGAVPIAAAIANAIVDAGGPRLRALPLSLIPAGAR